MAQYKIILNKRIILILHKKFSKKLNIKNKILLNIKLYTFQNN